MRAIKFANFIAACSIILLVTGCHKKSTSMETARPAWAGFVENEPKEPSVLQGNDVSENEIEEITKRLQTVFFDFDKFGIRDDQVPALRNNAHILQEYPNIYLLLEGHCDERGTEEYNLALAEQRASAVKSYLTFLGINAERIRTISYGESRPFALGHDESAWQENRRGQPVAMHSISGPQNQN